MKCFFTHMNVGLLVLLSLLSCELWADDKISTLDSLVEQDRLVVSAHIGEQSQLFVRQQIVLYIEVLTDSWFTKGTMIEHFDVANALVLRRNKFATNSTERINGKKYSKQIWEVVIYPLESGSYNIPPIELKVSVKDGKSNAKGKIKTLPLAFEVMDVPIKESINTVLVADDVKVTQDWNWVRVEGDSSEPFLKVGDVIEREISVNAVNTTSSFLPHVFGDNNTLGLASRYVEPPVFRDTHVRGDYTAKKSEKVVYVLQNAGSLTLPRITLRQWDPKLGILIEHHLEGETIEVKHTLSSYWRINSVSILSVGVLFFLSLMSLRLAISYYRRLKCTDRLPLIWQYILAIRSGNEVLCESLLYRKQHLKGLGLTLSSIPIKNEYLSTLQRRYQAQGQIDRRPFSSMYWLKLWLLV